MKNAPVKAVKNPTPYTGGKNPAVKTQKIPTRYTGGMNSGSIPKRAQGR
jgi:hypothetical protein